MLLNCTYVPHCPVAMETVISTRSVLWVLCAGGHVIRPLGCRRVVRVELLLRGWIPLRRLVVTPRRSIVALRRRLLVVASVVSGGRGCWLLAPGSNCGGGETTLTGRHQLINGPRHCLSATVECSEKVSKLHTKIDITPTGTYTDTHTTHARAHTHTHTYLVAVEGPDRVVV